MTKRVVIYVPGLGDSNYQGQKWLIASWRLWGVRPIMCRMNWSVPEQFEAKLQRLLDVIDYYAEQGSEVSLVGSSAGAGAVLNAFALRKDKIAGVVCIAGKVNNPEAIGPAYRRNSPAFVESAYRVQRSLDQLDFDADRPRIQSRFAWLDPVIPKEDSEVVGGNNRMVPSIGHAFTIATQLLFGAPFFLRFLQRPVR